MPAHPPLGLLIFRHPEDSDVVPFEDAIVRAFQGGKDAAGYVATGEDLGAELRAFESVPPDPADRTLDRCCHTLAIVLVDAAFLAKGGQSLWEWLEACWRHTRASNGRHHMLIVSMEERYADRIVERHPGLATLQMQPVQAFGERSTRPSILALLALHECRRMLAAHLPASGAAGQPPGFLRLFISHAKADGLPLAQSLKHHIRSFSWLTSFYDAEDLPPGCDWQKELEHGVGSSLIIMLRTDAYDGRYWCQREVCWADEYATPAVLVEARTALNHPAGMLPLHRIPTVRIPDGNLLRVLFVALREGLRFLSFRRLVEEMKAAGELPHPLELRVFSYAPSMPALLRACRSFAAATAEADIPRIILYPEPTLPGGVHEAALALVRTLVPGAQLVTPTTLLATGVARP
jgi:hypothetical protein